jgi:Flp pilus assembly pilin Flp
MKQLLWNLLSEEQGEDLIECSLLTALVALMSVGMFMTIGRNVSAIWATSNCQLTPSNVPTN